MNGISFFNDTNIVYPYRNMVKTEDSISLISIFFAHKFSSSKTVFGKVELSEIWLIINSLFLELNDA